MCARNLTVESGDSPYSRREGVLEERGGHPAVRYRTSDK